MSKTPPPIVDRRVAGVASRKPSKGEAALPPFDRRFQLDYPAIDDPGVRFRQPRSTGASAPAAKVNDITSGVILVPVNRDTLALAMVRTGLTDYADLVETALRQLGAPGDPADVPSGGAAG